MSKHLPAVMVETGLSDSTSMARRAIDAGAVRVNDTLVPAGQRDLPDEAVIETLQVGKHRKVEL